MFDLQQSRSDLDKARYDFYNARGAHMMNVYCFHRDRLEIAWLLPGSIVSVHSGRSVRHGLFVGVRLIEFDSGNYLIDFQILGLTADGKRVSQERHSYDIAKIDRIDYHGSYTLEIVPKGKNKKMPI